MAEWSGIHYGLIQIGTLSFNPTHRPLNKIYLALTQRIKFKHYLFVYQLTYLA